jgi:hypothetical protein
MPKRRASLCIGGSGQSRQYSRIGCRLSCSLMWTACSAEKEGPGREGLLDSLPGGFGLRFHLGPWRQTGAGTGPSYGRRMRNGMRFFAAFPVLCVAVGGVCDFDGPVSQKCVTHILSIQLENYIANRYFFAPYKRRRKVMYLPPSYCTHVAFIQHPMSHTTHEAGMHQGQRRPHPNASKSQILKQRQK